ncbi:hypothetical protein J5N97_016192 [Dioscorea zingiberensis]|uniref:KIB1-4 beta-propeller domain-containing protein n=1 Tax=Dioscorea zingiberensis TaxID=325984 RepID=A0A9D5CJB8_9LILI|nr:hypothetical protein J5N97_016192 [Dioscorea zingiberensis]
MTTDIIPVPPLITGWKIPKNGQGAFPNLPSKQESMKKFKLFKAILNSNPYKHRESDVYLFAIFNSMSRNSKIAYHKVTTLNAPMNYDQLYLVEVDCQIWTTMRFQYPHPENPTLKKGEFRFVKIRRVSPMNVAHAEVIDLENRAFFVGLNQSLWVLTTEHTQLKKNCIYYTNFPLKRDGDVNGHQDFGIFDIETHEIERVAGCPLEYPFTWVPSAWLMPYQNL